jgi:hypothetical protein
VALLTAAAKASVMNVISLVTGVTLSTQYRRERLCMAGLAFDLLVAAVKHKFRVAVVIKVPCQPCSRDMARLALVTQGALVYVFLFVATDTGFRRLAIARCFVARLARRRAMSSGQRKLRFVVVKECLGPLRIGMTCHAVFAQFAFVNIILLVARQAGGICLFGIQRPGVTLITRQRRMTTGQRKFGELVVVERVVFPVARVVTRVAAIAVIALVGVILLVATYACHGNVAIAIRLGVASVTACRAVLVKQREPSLRVIVVWHAPIFRAVTTLTLFA